MDSLLLDAARGDGQGLAGFVARWEEASPSLDNFFVRPSSGDVGVEAHQDV